MKRRPQTASEVARHSFSPTPDSVLEDIRKGLYTPLSSSSLNDAVTAVDLGSGADSAARELNKSRIAKALEDPTEAGQVAAEFIRNSTGQAEYLGAGVQSVAFRLGGGKVGKLQMRESYTGFSGFTPPRKLKEINHPISRKTFGQTQVEITHEATMGGKADLFAAYDLESSLRKKGYIWHDAAERNIGVVNGEVKIIDLGHMSKSRMAEKVRDYGMKMGLDRQEVMDLIRRRSRTAVALSAEDASNLRKLIDVAASNRRTKAIMRLAATREGAGKVTNFVVRAAKTL